MARRPARGAPTTGSSSSGPPSGPGNKRRRPGDRIRPRKYTKINSEIIDYKDLMLLRRFISDRGKVRSRRVTGLSRKHQVELALAVRRARELALLPYVGDR
jgi:small subunit ribosomal protein S18